MEWQSLLHHHGADVVEDAVQVDSRVVRVGLRESREFEPEIDLEAFQQGEIGGRSACGVQLDLVRASLGAPCHLDGHEHQRRADILASGRPHQRSHGQIQAVGAGLLHQGPRVGGDPLQGAVVGVCGEVDLDLEVVREPGRKVRRVEFLAEQPACPPRLLGAFPGGPQADLTVAADDVLERADDGFGHGQFDDRLALERGVRAVDQPVPQREVQQLPFPDLDPLRGLVLLLEQSRGAVIVQDDGVRAGLRTVFDLDDVVVLVPAPGRKRADPMRPCLAHGEHQLHVPAVGPDPAPRGAVQRGEHGSRGIRQHRRLDQPDVAPVDVVHDHRAGHRDVLGRMLVGFPVAQQDVGREKDEERLDVHVLERARHQHRGVHAGGEPALEDVLGGTDGLRGQLPVRWRIRVGDASFVDRRREGLHDLIHAFRAGLVGLERARSRRCLQHRCSRADQRDEVGLVWLHERRERSKHLRGRPPQHPLPRCQNVRAFDCLLADVPVLLQSHPDRGPAGLSHLQQHRPVERHHRRLHCGFPADVGPERPRRHQLLVVMLDDDRDRHCIEPVKVAWTRCVYDLQRLIDIDFCVRGVPGFPFLIRLLVAGLLTFGDWQFEGDLDRRRDAGHRLRVRQCGRRADADLHGVQWRRILVGVLGICDICDIRLRLGLRPGPRFGPRFGFVVWIRFRSRGRRGIVRDRRFGRHRNLRGPGGEGGCRFGNGLVNRSHETTCIGADDVRDLRESVVGFDHPEDVGDVRQDGHGAQVVEPAPVDRVVTGLPRLVEVGPQLDVRVQDRPAVRATASQCEDQRRQVAEVHVRRLDRAVDRRPAPRFSSRVDLLLHIRRQVLREDLQERMAHVFQVLVLHVACSFGRRRLSAAILAGNGASLYAVDGRPSTHSAILRPRASIAAPACAR